MMVFGGRWFKHYQRWLLLFANTLLGRLVLGIPLKAGQVRKLTPDTCAWSRDGVHYQARVYAGKQYANRLYYALKPLWWTLHTVDSINARCGWQLNFGFDTLNVYSPDGTVSMTAVAGQQTANASFQTLHDGAGNDNSQFSFSLGLQASTSSTKYNSLYRALMTFRTDAIVPAGAKAAAVSVSAASLSAYVHSKYNTLGSDVLCLVASTPASNTAVANADYTQVGTTQLADDKAYADVATAAYNTFDLNAAGVANINPASTHSRFGLRIGWDRANSYGGTWASSKKTVFILLSEASKYPYLALTYTVHAAPTVTASAITAASVGYVAGQFTLGGEAVTQATLLVADNPAFSTPAVDTGWIATALAVGDATRLLGIWTPSVAGHYYGKLGVDSDYYTVYGDPVAFDVAFPTVTSITRAQNRETFTWAVVVADTYKQPPRVSVIVDDQSFNAVLISSAAGSYTYTATAQLERGKHQVKAVVANLWQIITTAYESFYAEYTAPTPGVSIFMGEEKIEAWGANVSDALLPEYPVLKFTSSAWVPGGQTVSAVCYLRGVKRYEFVRRYASKNDDGTWTYQCESIDKQRLEEVTTFMANAMGIHNALAQVITPMRLADDYSTLMAGFLYETKWELTPKATVVSQLLIQAGVNAWSRAGTLYCHNMDVSAETPRLAVRMNDVKAAFQEDAQTFDWVRVWYAIKQYPVVETLLTDYDAAGWTGTVANALYTTDGILPASGALHCLSGNGAITRAGLLANFADFDRLKMRWCPPSGTVSLSITLQTDASNKYTFTRSFAGQTGAGFNLTGGTGPDGTVTKTIALGNRRIVSATGQMTQPCTVTVRVKLGGVTLWTSDPTLTSGDSNTWGVSVPASIYEANLMDTLELEFTQLYYVANTYGVSCVKLDISEYVQTTQITGSHSYIVSRTKVEFSLPMSTVIVGGVGYIRFGEVLLCPKPALAEDQSIGINQDRCQLTMYRAAAGGGIYLTTQSTYPSIFERGGNFYATYGDIAMGNNPGDVQSAILAKGTATICVMSVTYDTILVWQTTAFQWQSTYNLWDEIDLPLSAFTKTGSPTTLVSIILSATGLNHYDGLCLYANEPKNRYVDAKSGTGSRKMPDRTGDGFGSESAARAFANGLLALVSTPSKDYAIEKPLDTDIELGDPVDCDGETLAVYGISYDFEQGKMIVQVGKRVQETLEVLKNHAERIDRLESRR